MKLVFEQELLEEEVPRRSQEKRQRAKGAGRKPRLETVESKLIYILFYFKCYPTFDLAGILFDLDRSQVEPGGSRLAKRVGLPKAIVGCTDYRKY